MVSESGGRKPTPAEVAKYISDLASELAVMARSAEQDALGYILEMARLEADEALRRSDGRR